MEVRLKRAAMEKMPIVIKMTNNIFQPLAFPFTLRTTPMTISTTPTIRFPTAIERVDSLLTSSLCPFTKARTSLDASILKHPPRKAPHRVLNKKYTKMVTLIAQKIVNMAVTAKQLQKSEQSFIWLKRRDMLSLQSAYEEFEVLQKEPRMNEPTSAPMLKKMGTVDLQCAKLFCVRQLGIHNRKPYSIDFSSPIATRYNLFSYRTIIALENIQNSCAQVNQADLSKTQVAFVYSQSSSILRQINKEAAQLSTAAMIIRYSHLHRQIVTNMPERPRPIMFPMSPQADHAPVMSPYFSTMKCRLIMVSSVGHAGNWQNPKTSRLTPGNTSFKRKLPCTRSPRKMELSGMQRQAALAMLMKMKQTSMRCFLVEKQKRVRKPTPRERQIAASNRPRKRWLWWKASLNSGLIWAQAMRMECREAQARKVRLKVCHLLKVRPFQFIILINRCTSNNLASTALKPDISGQESNL